MVIVRALDALEAASSKTSVAPADGATIALRSSPQDDEVQQINLDQLPDFTSSKPRKASIGDEETEVTGWGQLRNELLIMAYRKTGDAGKVIDRLPIAIKKGRHTGNGYKYLEELDMSVGGPSANDGCRAIICLAKKFAIPVGVHIEWLPGKKTALSGQHRLLLINRAPK